MYLDLTDKEVVCRHIIYNSFTYEDLEKLGISNDKEEIIDWLIEFLVDIVSSDNGKLDAKRLLKGFIAFVDKKEY